MADRERKLSENEAVFRAFNEGVLEVEQQAGGSRLVEFVCECSDPTCEGRIKLPVDAYEEVRSDPIRFVIRRGHEVSALETVVLETETYAVIEKQQGDAADVAERER